MSQVAVRSAVTLVPGKFTSPAFEGNRLNSRRMVAYLAQTSELGEVDMAQASRPAATGGGPLDYQAVIIGRRFGGAVVGCRTAKKWPGEILIIERGKRYPMGSFPRSPHGM